MQKEAGKDGPSRTPVLTVKNVSYWYGAKQALDDVSFEVYPGRVTALLGPNGAGKTTLFSLITRLFDAPEGRIEICGRSASEWGAKALGPLGVVFQQPTLDLDLTVKQNLRYFSALRGLKRKEADERMLRALTNLDMAERIGERVRSLNGGHRRRVEIARSLLHSPKLLLLDEPTIGLDDPTRRAIVRHVHELARTDNIGVLWATHLFDEVQPDDDLLVINRGKIVARGRGQGRGGGDRRQGSRRRLHAADRRRYGRGCRRMNLMHYVRAFYGIVWRELLRFLQQRERFFAALVRPLIWLIIFAAGFRAALGISIIPPYQTYITYDVYITPGLLAMIQLFQGMQSSLSMVYDREMGSMRVLLTTPLAALVPAGLAAVRRRDRLAVPGLRVPPRRLFLRRRAAALGLSHGAAGADPDRPDVRRARHAAVVDHQAAREFRRHHEFRDLPDVLRVVGALSAVEDARGKPLALLHLPLQPVHLGGRADPLRLLSRGELDRARRGRRVHAAVPGAVGLGL